MKKILLILIISYGLIPCRGLATAQKIFSGTVTAITGTQLEFVAINGAYYSIQTQNVSLIKRYGAPMQVTEIIIGDKIQATGLARPDNSLAATTVRDMSLYVHNSTFTGKIVALSPLSGYLTINSRQWGEQTIRTDAYTVFKKNAASATINDLTAGMTVTVKGVWERNYKDIQAASVQAIIRLVAIDITGNLVMRGTDSLTVVANNTIYGIDLGGAALANKKNQPITVGQLGMGDTLRVWGKHISGGTEIAAGKVKDTTR